MRIEYYQEGLFSNSIAKPEGATVVKTGKAAVIFYNGELDFIEQLKGVSKKKKNELVMQFAVLAANHTHWHHEC